MGRKSKRSEAEKVEAVLTLLRQQEPAAVLARRCGVSEATLYRWRAEFLEGGKAALAGHGAGSNGSTRRVAELEAQPGERDRVIGELTVAHRTPTRLGRLERFHQTLKAEEVYWRLYDHPQHARLCLGEFRPRYNHLRPHGALVPTEGGDPLTPYEGYVGARAAQIHQWQHWAQAAKARLDARMAAA